MPHKTWTITCTKQENEHILLTILYYAVKQEQIKTQSEVQTLGNKHLFYGITNLFWKSTTP